VSGTDVFVLVSLVGMLVFMGVVLWKAGIRSPKPGQVEMVLMGAAAGAAEAHLWSTALKTAGITCHLVNVGDFYPTEGGPTAGV